MIWLIAIAAFVATYMGGLLALRLRDKLHLILGFSAGAVIGVAFFDLLPEALDLSTNVSSALAITALGFLIYLTLDRLLVLHSHHDDEGHHHERGLIGAATLSLHSLLDGVGIGLAFHYSVPVGVVVAAAVLTHDFSDGINTVNMITKHSGSRAKAMRWLIVDALAPVVGIILTMFVTVSEPQLGALLALFAGFFIYIGASDLIPESHHAHPTFLTTVLTLVGAAVLFVVVKLAGL